MSFEHPGMLFLFILPLMWILSNWGQKLRRRSWLLLASGIAILLIASKPQFVLGDSRMAVTVLADGSSNISDPDLRKESDFIHTLERLRRKNELRVIPFGQGLGTTQVSRLESWSAAHLTGAAARGIDIESAVRAAITALPADRVRRIVIISDGRETVGNLLRTADQAKMLGIPIDTIPLGRRFSRDLRLDSATLPTTTFAGESFSIHLVLTSPRQMDAQVIVSSDRQPRNARSVPLEEGVNHVRIRTKLVDPGNAHLSISIKAGHAGELQVSQNTWVQQPHALLISSSSSGVVPRLMNFLASSHFEVSHRESVPANLLDRQLVLLDLNARSTLLQDQQSAIKGFVRQGGVLVAIDGEPDSAAGADQIERMLPAKFLQTDAVPNCFLLVLEKSLSMAGKQMELAKLSALEIVENLRRSDLVGVLAFDDVPRWLVPIGPTNDRTSIADRIESISAGGGTRLAPALEEALRHILSTGVSSKHIILVTDGRSKDIDVLSLVREAKAKHVTISTVGLVDQTNSSYLAKLAQSTAGLSYLVTEPWDLERTLFHDAVLYAALGPPGNNALPGDPSAPASLQHDAARFLLKHKAQVVVRSSQGDPLLIGWQYGLGRSEIVTSTAQAADPKSPLISRISESIWRTVADGIPDEQVEVVTGYEPTHDEFVIEYRAGQPGQLAALKSGIYLSGPNGSGGPVKVERVSENVFRAHASCDHMSGTFRVHSLDDAINIPQVLLYKSDQELDDQGSNDGLLRQVSALTSGTFNPSPSDIFESHGRTATRRVDLWPALAGAAMVLILAFWISPHRVRLARWLDFGVAKHRIHPRMP